MQKEQKASIVQELTETLTNADVLYLTDTADLNAESISNLRRICFKTDIQLRVVKNTLLRKAFEQVKDRDYSEFYDL
jgi:large subunit ribosomal protein L10